MAKAVHLVIGYGEVGSAVGKIIMKKDEVFWFDVKAGNNPPPKGKKIDVLHICIPDSDMFADIAKGYIKRYNPKFIVNHSTTVPGKTVLLGKNRAVHSPILGQHDNLVKHVKTFTKAVGYDSPTAKRLAEKYLKKFFKLEFFKNSKSTEFVKILLLCKFAVNIEMARYAQQVCEKLKFDYDDSVRKFCGIYNDGYGKVGLPQFNEKVLKPPKAKIGGHCVLPGVEKGNRILKNELLSGILKLNSRY